MLLCPPARLDLGIMLARLEGPLHVRIRGQIINILGRSEQCPEFLLTFKSLNTSDFPKHCLGARVCHAYKNP